MFFNCELCGTRKADQQFRVLTTCMTTSKPLCSICKQVESVDEEIAEARLRVQKLIAKRRGLVTQHNRKHHPFFRLPAELISRIFTFCTFPFTQDQEMLFENDAENIKFPESFTLSAICSTTRFIALNDPHLWTCIAISFDRTADDFSSNQTEMVKMHLQRSGSLPLTIVLSTRWGRRKISEHSMAYIDEIKRHSERWQSLIVSLPEDLIRRLGKGPGSLKAPLRNLSLMSNPEPSLYDFEGTADSCFTMNRDICPSPRNVSLNLRGSSTVIIDWTAVTVASLQLSVPEVFGFLQQTTQLRELDLSLLRHYAHGSLPLVTLTQLQRLKLGDHPNGFLDRLTLPSLTSLSVSIESPRHFTDRVFALITRSNCQLRCIDLGFWGDFRTFDELLERIPSLEEVSIYHYAFTPVLQRLIQEDCNSNIIAPNLRRITLQAPTTNPVWELLPKTFSSNRPLRFFTVELLDAARCLYIPETTIEDYTNCAGKGYHLEIYTVDLRGNRQDFIEESKEYNSRMKELGVCERTLGEYEASDDESGDE